MPSPNTTACFSIARSRARRSSRSRAARSYSSTLAAAFISASRREANRLVWPAMKSQKSSARARCSSALIRLTHGAEHLPMYPSRQGRPIWPDRLNTPAEQVRTGNTRSSVSTVSRMAQAWLYGPKYLVPFRLAPRMTMTRGYSSPMVTAR